jgi:hypothetical protein
MVWRDAHWGSLWVAVAAVLCLWFAAMAHAQAPPNGLAVLNQGIGARALTKSDTVKILTTRGVYIGDATPCNIAVVFNGDSAAVTLTNVQGGVTYPFSINQLMSTNTTCATVFGLY